MLSAPPGRAVPFEGAAKGKDVDSGVVSRHASGQKNLAHNAAPCRFYLHPFVPLGRRQPYMLFILVCVGNFSCLTQAVISAFFANDAFAPPPLVREAFRGGAPEDSPQFGGLLGASRPDGRGCEGPLW